MKRIKYKRRKTNLLSFPLGGIGTGCIGLAGNGRLIDWEIAELAFKGAAFPGDVSMLAFNPFIPLNDRDSGIPAAELLLDRFFELGGNCFDTSHAYAGTNGLGCFSLVSDQFSLARIVDAWWAGGGGGNSYWASCSEPGFRAWFEETQMPLVPWSSQASGFFLDDDQRDAMFDFDRCWRTDDNLERRARARKLAEKYGVRAVNIALAWVLSQDFPVFPIIGSRRPFEIEDSLKALDLRLTEDERRWLDLER